MDWLMRWRRKARATKPELLGEAEAVELGEVRDLAVLLAASELLSGPGVVLYLEGSHFAPEVRAFLETRPDPEGRREVARGTIWPRALTFHLPLDGELVSRLRELTVRHASPEICEHLVVYSGEHTLLEAYDAGGGQVYVSANLSQAMLADMRRALTPDA